MNIQAEKLLFFSFYVYFTGELMGRQPDFEQKSFLF